LTGCSGESDAQKAVEDAELSLRKVSIGDPTLSPSISESAYREAEQAVTDYAGAGKPFGEAASVSLAIAKLGQSALAGQDASDAETESLHKSRIVRARLSEWITMNAIAKASMNFDVSADSDQLRELIALRRQDVTQFEDMLSTIQTEIDGYEAQIADLESKASEERNESARYELRMPNVSAQEAAQLAERVREHTLRADAYELESIRVQGKLERVLPESREIANQVEKAKGQIKLLNESLDEIAQRVKNAEQDARDARQRADSAQQALVSLIDELESFRADTAAPAHARVERSIRDALNALRDVKENATTAGYLATSTAQQHLARALERQARGEADMALLFESILAANVPGPWADRMNDHSAARDDFQQRAQQAFLDAANAMRRARARGENGDRLEAAAIRLEALGGQTPEPEETFEEESYDDESYDNAEDGSDVEMIDDEESDG
jgi:chromosome segregation ATPase